jgi:hypothetical protein
MRPILALAIVLGVLAFSPAAAMGSGAPAGTAADVEDSSEMETTETAATTTENSGDTGSAATEDPIIPKWRLSVLALAQSTSYRPMLGVYYRVGGRTDLGLSIDSNINILDRENENDDSGRGLDAETYDFTASTDLRRWGRINDRVCWYWGGRLSGGYTHSESKDSYGNRRREYIRHERMVGMSFVIGADLKLLDHLSGSVSFVPIQGKYAWNKYENIYIIEETETEEASRDTSTDKSDTFYVWTKPNAAAYLSLTF